MEVSTDGTVLPFWCTACMKMCYFILKSEAIVSMKILTSTLLISKVC
jgi:hypothetical protein